MIEWFNNCWVLLAVDLKKTTSQRQIPGSISFFLFFTINTFITGAKTRGGFICLSGSWFSSDRTPAPCPLMRSHLLSHTDLVLKRCIQEACLVGTAPLEDCWFWHSFSFLHISSEFSLVIFVTTFSFARVNLTPCGPGAVRSRTRTTVILCAVSEHDAVLY